jgi:hypothetical protein
MITYVENKTTLHDQLAVIQNELQTRKWGDIHKIILMDRNKRTSEQFKWNVQYHEDENGDLYALLLEPSLPTDIYVEIDDGTYGDFRGWRIYR